MITTGSVQAPEELYLYRGDDAREEGLRRDDLRRPGSGPLRHQSARSPTATRESPPSSPPTSSTAPRTRCSFLLSTPESPYVPRPERHAPGPFTARGRTAASPRAATPPTTRSTTCSTPTRIGIVGHSLGATAVSTVCCTGPLTHRSWTRRGLGQPVGPSGGIVPRVPAIGHVDRLRAHPDAVHRRAEPAVEEQRLEQLLDRRHRHRPAQLPRRHPLRVVLHPQPGVRRDLARHGHGGLVHGGLARQVREGRSDARTRACSPTAGGTTTSSRGSTRTSTATCSRSTSARASTSTSRVVGTSGARTCATSRQAARGRTAAPRRLRTTDCRRTTPISRRRRLPIRAPTSRSPISIRPIPSRWGSHSPTRLR